MALAEVDVVVSTSASGSVASPPATSTAVLLNSWASGPIGDCLAVGKPWSVTVMVSSVMSPPEKSCAAAGRLAGSISLIVWASILWTM